MPKSKRGRLYRRFTEFNPAFAWNVFKQLVSAQCLQGCGIPVSHILSAPLFNLNSVFVRQPQRGFAERAQSNEFIACGHITHVLKYGDANFHAKIDHFWRVDENCSNQPHVFTWSDNDWRHGRKSITVRIEGIRKLCSASFLPTECQLDPSALPVKPMPADTYIIHEVWYAKQLQIFQELNGKFTEWEWRYIPIGFALVKYTECRLDGWLGYPRELHRTPWFTGDFKVCRYLETLVRSRFFVQQDGRPGRPQRPSETFLASDEVGGKRKLNPDEIRNRFEQWRSQKTESDRSRRRRREASGRAEISNAPTAFDFDDVFEPSALVPPIQAPAAADKNSSYSSLIASPLNFADNKLYESLLDLAGTAAVSAVYPHPPDLATLPGEPPIRRHTTRTIPGDSGDYVEIPVALHPRTAKDGSNNRFLSPIPKGPAIKNEQGLAPAGSGPNVAAWVRTGYPYVEGEPRTLLRPPKDHQAIGRWSVEEAAARRHAIETVRAQESSRYRRRKSIKRIGSDPSMLHQVPFARRRLVAITEEDEGVVIVGESHPNEMKVPENPAFMQGRHVSEPAPKIRRSGNEIGSSSSFCLDVRPQQNSDVLGLPGVTAGSEEVFDLQSPAQQELESRSKASKEQVAARDEPLGDVSTGRSITELVRHTNGTPQPQQKNRESDREAWQIARFRLNSSPQPVAPVSLQPLLDDNNNEDDESQRVPFWKRMFKIKD